MNSETIETHIRDIVEEFIKDKYLTIGGKVYYRGLRPICENPSSYPEDAVVAFLTGTSGDIQNGTCLVNVYTNDIKAPSGMYYKNKTRCEEIAAALDLFPAYATQHDKVLYFKQSDIIRTVAEEEIHQHFVSLKMEFKVLNENY